MAASDDSGVGLARRRIYRTIEVATWTDRKFRKLSRMPPSGQGLWLYLLTGPHTGLMPGLYNAGRAGLAEKLRWSLDDFDAAFAELEEQGMAFADWNEGVVWLPQGLKHNPPANPNMILRWAADLELVPECALRMHAIAALEAHVRTRDPIFVEAFLQAFGPTLRGLQQHANVDVNGYGNGSPNDSPNGSANGSALARARACRYQEQEQEQEQKQDQEPATAARSRRAPAKARPRPAFDPLAIELPDWLAPELWESWVKHRRAIKKPITEDGARLSLRRLSEFRAQGVDPRAAIETSIANDWQGLVPPRRGPARAPPPRAMQQEDLLESNRAAAADWAATQRQLRTGASEP